jgi:hypothetical protein
VVKIIPVVSSGDLTAKAQRARRKIRESFIILMKRGFDIKWGSIGLHSSLLSSSVSSAFSVVKIIPVVSETIGLKNADNRDLSAFIKAYLGFK